MKTKFVMATAVAVCSVVTAPQSVLGGGGCPDIGDTSGVNDGFPNRLSSLVGTDIRTGAHDCFERVVIEFGGSGELPGYHVRYEPDPIIESPSGNPVEVAGGATLVVSYGAWMPDMEGNGYSGPREFVPDNVSNILELQQIENHEGQGAWAIGLDQQRGFAVSTLTDPVRIVIDIELDPGAPAPTTAPPVATTVPGGQPPVSLPPTR